MGLILFVTICLYGLTLAPGLITAIIARNKGYRPWFWILSMGPVGLLIMVVMSALDRAETPEERERWESRADWTGGVLSGLTFLTVFVFPILGAAAFLTARTAMIPVPPPIAPPPIAPPMVVTPELPPATGDDLKIEPPAKATPAEEPRDADPAANGNPK